MSEKTEVLIVKDQLPVKPAPSVAEMLQAVVERGITGENVSALKEMVGLYERMQDREAEKEFARAFVELQKEIPRIQTCKPVPKKDGSVKYMYAPLEEIDMQVRPMCLKNGFTYWWEEGEQKDGKITKIFNLQHVGGHKRTNPYTVRIGDGPPDSTMSQKDMSAHSYAKRGALCDGLCIVVANQDDDARNEGGAITPDQAASLSKRVLATGSDAKAFLAYAGAATFDEIAGVKYDMLDALLRRKEVKK